ncbi:MAG: Rpn family recombination-promoting nuclease/putative transposase [Oligoflexia bacterium]|nr:Rpn family recombination-promoting nuclease/putative transposase [Oligoflexia bacterium]
MGKLLIGFDWAMKKLLRSKTNFDVLEGFLSELLERDVKIRSVLESESNKDNRNDKFNKVDILVEENSGELVIIEVQIESEPDYLTRILYGVAKCISEHMSEGSTYKQVKKVYSVSIVYFDFGMGADYVYHGNMEMRGIHYGDELKLTHNQQRLYQKTRIAEVYPEFYLIKINNFNQLAQNTLDEWIYFLRHEEIPDNFKAKGLSAAKEKFSILKLPKDEQLAYRRYQENQRYAASMLEGAHLEGKDEGLAEGLIKGLEKGRIEGETKAKLDLAKGLLDLLDDKTIAEKTGMSLEDIARIRDKNV